MSESLPRGNGGRLWQAKPAEGKQYGNLGRPRLCEGHCRSCSLRFSTWDLGAKAPASSRVQQGWSSAGLHFRVGRYQDTSKAVRK